MNRALNPGEFFTFEEFQSDGQSGWTCLESFLHQSPSVPHSPWRVQMDARSRTSVLFHVSPLLVEVPDFENRIRRRISVESDVESDDYHLYVESDDSPFP